MSVQSWCTRHTFPRWYSIVRCWRISGICWLISGGLKCWSNLWTPWSPWLQQSMWYVSGRCRSRRGLPCIRNSVHISWRSRPWPRTWRSGFSVRSIIWSIFLIDIIGTMKYDEDEVWFCFELSCLLDADGDKDAFLPIILNTFIVGWCGIATPTASVQN